ncbi:MAG: sigma-70 family RNA polymerase sigma factor [Ruminococcus sp.]|nr:sigma-70 family RNA polymerase sigma factor [Ruminococcus sp.]
MGKRKSYRDTSTGAADQYIRSILDNKHESSIRSILVNIIKNDLTPRQNEIIMLYYFKGDSMAEIASKQGVSIQSVSAVISRARNRIFRLMKYYFH